MPKLDALQAKLGYEFQEIALLEQALTHRSVDQHHYERLEFLGDSVLSFVMSDILYRQNDKLREGELSRVRANLVNGEVLANIARDYELGTYLRLGHGEVNSGGQGRDSILADALEAVIAAVYLDGGLAAAQQLIWHLFDCQDFDALVHKKLKKDPKSALQEWAQARKYALPTYEAEVSGLAHEQTFAVTCTIEGIDQQGYGESTNRRKAEREAAQALLKKINNML